MDPLAIGNHAAGGQMRITAGVPDKETKSVAASTAIQIELLAPGSIAFGDQPGISGLRSAIDPGFDRKSGVAGGGKSIWILVTQLLLAAR